jgi:hypothetical protein
LVLLWTAIRAAALGGGRAHFLLSSWSLGESHRRRLCPASCFSPVVYRKKQGTEWVGPRARSLIAASRLAMLAAVQGDNGVQ